MSHAQWCDQARNIFVGTLTVVAAVGHAAGLVWNFLSFLSLIYISTEQLDV